MRPLADARLREIEELYRRSFLHFVGVAIGVTGDRELAVEAVQDAFASVVRSRRTFRGQGPLEAWVWRAVVNAARKARTRDERARAAESVGRVGNGHEGEEGLELGSAIAVLPERQRLALFLRYFADLDYRAIAAVLGVEVGTVSATLSSAHSTLRRQLQERAR